MADKNTYKNRSFAMLLFGLAVILVINLVGNSFFHRWDLTKEKRYTLSPSTKALLRDLNEPLDVQVYLTGDDLPAGIRKLKNSTRELLNEFRALSGGMLDYKFIDIYKIEDDKDREALEQSLLKGGLYPTNLEVKQDAGFTEKLIYPGAVFTNGDRNIAVQILENQMAFNTQDVLNNSYNFLEFKLANTIKKLMLTRPYRVAVTEGHGEPSNARMSDLLQTLSLQDFQVQRLDMTSQSILQAGADLVIISKPQKPFNELEKFEIDQYIMHGGKVLWMLDGAIGDLDSFRIAPSYMAVERPLNLEDQLFRYGVRVNKDLVQDIYCNPVPVTENEGGEPKTSLYPWIFHPVINTPDDHAISKNLDPLIIEFASSIDTVKVKGIKKTILLKTSEFTRTSSTPVGLDLGLATIEPLPEYFDKSEISLGVLLEGEFRSLYENRLTSAFRELLHNSNKSFIATSGQNKQIVFSDGDLGVNDMDPTGVPLPLGYYRYTRETFANKDFLLNCIEYLLDEEDLIGSRNKETTMQLLDKQMVKEKKGMWQFLHLGIPLIFTLLIGGTIRWFRKRKYVIGITS